MSDFCTKCSEKEAQIELMTKQHYKEIQYCKERIENLRQENETLRRQNEALILDVAFYNKDICLPTKDGV
jgi:cell division protein FtsB